MRNSIKNKNTTLWKRIIGVAVATVMLVTNVPVMPFQGLINISLPAHAADVVYPDYPSSQYDSTNKIAYIASVEDLILYSQAYYSHSDDHKSDTIDIAIAGGIFSGVALNGFIAIGTSINPFEGTLKIAGDIDQAFCLPVAFFDHISDKATITGGASGELLIARTVNESSEPILAKHVHSGNTGSANTWKVKVCPYVTEVENENVTYINNNAGIIGEIQDDAKIVIEVNDTNNNGTTYGNIKATSGDAGYICGKLGRNAKLTVNSVQGTNTGYSITAKAGNAGGVVGAMDEGSELTLNCTMNGAAPTITASADGKYAGGLVGRNEGGKITLGSSFSSTAYPVNGTVVGKKGSGGLFGYYRPVFTKESGTYVYEYKIGDYNISVNVNGTGSVGGLFGVMDNQQLDSITPASGSTAEVRTYKAGGNITISGTSYSTTHSDGAVDNFGGLIGYYSSYASGSVLKVDGVSVSPTKSGGKYTNYGGLIGAVKENNAAYFLFDGCTVNATGTGDGNFGGLIGAANNAFVDVTGTTTITAASYKGGGVVGSFDDGVLRLAGTTDLAGTSCAEGGQIVNTRDSALIYAESNWKLTRGSVTTFDDIGSWGEALRFSKLTKASVLDDSASTHIISLVAPVSTIGNINDFAKDAICFSIKVGNSNVGTPEKPAYNGNPWLAYESGATVLDAESASTALSLSADISLAETGLTGLTRDSGSDRVTFKGSLNGGDHTITLAIGDASAPSNVAGFNGKIYRHTLNGLFGVLDGATVSNLTLAGTVNVDASADMFAGALAAKSSGALMATDVSVTAAFTADGDSAVTLGRLVGESAGTFNITNTAQTASNHNGIDYGEYSGNVTSENESEDTCVGGMIGKVTAASGSCTISDVALSGDITNMEAKAEQQIGGLIAVIDNSTNARTLNLSGINLNGMNIEEKATDTAGGLLGYAWYNTNVNVTVSNSKGVAVTNGTLKVTGSGTSVDLGGLVYCATGKWEIPANGLNMDGATITASGTDSASAGSFGMIINKGWHNPTSTNDFFTADDSSAIYLLLTTTNSFACDDATIALPTGIVFDELVAYSAYYREDSNGRYNTDTSGDPYILQNGNGIISIKTSSLNASGSGASNTYQPQIAQDSNGTAYQNKWTRYYYNLDAMTGDGAQQKLMRWGLSQYAHKSLSSYFTNPFSDNVFDDAHNETSATGYYDMTGYSWYPVDVNSKTVTVKGTFKFANAEFETCETANNVNVSDSTKPSTSKSSLKQTQHYMMHEGLFRNVNYSTITLNNAKWQGSISQLTDGYGTNAEKGTGVLVFGKMTGKDGGHSAVNSSSGKIVLDGIHVCNATLTENGGDYAPLLINKVDNYCDLTIHDVSVGTLTTETPAANEGVPSTVTYSSWYKDHVSTYPYAASSLIGNVGLSTTANNLRVNFTKIKLDGRKAGNSLGTDINNDLDSIYLTTHSIFSRASLLNQFQYANGSDGAYTFSYTDDWTDTAASGDTPATHVHKGDVTYGSEISGHPLVNNVISKDQYFGKEFWYNNEDHTSGSGKYTNYGTSVSTGGETNSAPVSFAEFRPYVYDSDLNANMTSGKKHQLKVNHATATLTGCGTYNDPYMISSGEQLSKIANIINGTSADGVEIDLPNLNSTNTSFAASDLVKNKWDNYGHSTFQQSATNFVLKTNTSKSYTKIKVREYLAGAYYMLADDIDLDSEYPGLGVTSDNYAVFRGVIIGDSKTITNKSTKPLIAASHGSVIRNLTIYADSEEIEATKYDDTSTTSTNEAVAAYSSSRSWEAYGAVIGMVFGGDNIIENVKVGFGDNPDTTDAVESGKITISGDGDYLAPVGGYIGVVVNGAVIFKNMTRNIDGVKGLNNSTVYESDGTTAIAMNSTKYLYVNPIIGRVLNGYAVTETASSYRPFESGIRTYPDGSKAYCRTVNGDTKITYLDKTDSTINFTSLDATYTAAAEPVTMRNGTKNYSIPDISKSDTGKLKVGDFTVTVEGGSYYNTKVTLEDAQALFLFSALIQSGATQNTDNKSVLKNNLSYNSSDYKTAHVADYDEVGQGAAGSTAPTTGDYVDTLKDGYSGANVRPYIVQKYCYVTTTDENEITTTTYQDGIFRVTYSKSMLNMQLGADGQTSASTFYLPDGFKGIGCNLVNNNYVSLFGLDGQGNNVSLDMSLQYYHQPIANNSTTVADTRIDNYRPAVVGFGFINYLRQNINGSSFEDPLTNSSSQIHDIIISGNVYSDVYKTDGTTSDYDYGSNQVDSDLEIVSVGGLAGTAANNNKDTIFIKNLYLKNLSVFGAKTVGGAIGYANTNSKVNAIYFYDCGADNLTVSAGHQAGGLVGAANSSVSNKDNTLTINGDSTNTGNNTQFKLKAVNLISQKTGMDASSYSNAKNRGYYAGGLIGRNKNTVTISNVDVGVLDSNYSGFVGNSNRANDNLNEQSETGKTYTANSWHNSKPFSIVGGLVGAVSLQNNAILNASNCNIYNINIYGGYCGGISGRPEYTANLYNCKVSSTQSETNMGSSDGKALYMISGWYGIGGLVGEPRAQNTIDGCEVSNYVIRCYSQYNSNSLAHAGGMVGRSNGAAAYIRNSAVIKCYIEGRGKSDKGDEDTDEGIGGLIGVNEKGINGYNILIKDIKLLANNDSAKIANKFEYKKIDDSTNKLQNGYVGGANQSGGAVKIVGFSLQITDSTNDTISDPWYSKTKPNETESFFIRADYNCACDSDDNSKRSKAFSNITIDPSTYTGGNVKDFTSTANKKPEITDNHPYVTSSPLRYISATQFLTGDAVWGSSFNDLIAKKIVTDATAATKPKGYYEDIKLAFTSLDKDKKTGTLALDGKPAANDSNLAAYKEKFPALFLDEQGNEITNTANYPTYSEMYLSELEAKFSTFKTKAKDSPLPAQYDFPVLVLDDGNAYVTTELINNYLRILTNTSYDFADTSSGMYYVKFGKCTYSATGDNANKFTVDWTDANLGISNGYFDIANSYDNTVDDGQFTLIDVQFKTPAQISSKNYIAYHLYVPVFVDKMLKYDFECSTLSGTTYQISSYENAPRNNMLLENLETPVTVQFSWTYYRTLEEWVKQIEGGESLLHSFSKKIKVENVGANAFPYSNMVLVDANNHNKPYYASHQLSNSGKADAYDSTNKLIKLSDFTTDGLAKIGSNDYCPLDFNDYFDITTSTTKVMGDNAKYTVKCVSLGTASTGGTIKKDNNYYRPFSESDDEANAVWLTFAFKNGMTVVKDNNTYLSEAYYISFFTEASELIYHMVFSSQQSFDDDADVPTDRNSTGNGSTHLFLGEIYENHFDFVYADASKALNIGSTAITAQFKADIRIADSSKNIVASYINTPTVRVYQSFLVNYQNDSLGSDGAIHSERGIKTPANVTLNSYFIDSENITSGEAGLGRKNVKDLVLADSNCDISVANGTITNNFIELRNNQDLKTYLKKAYDVNPTNIPFITIKADFTLNYTGENDADTKNKITAQFPLRDETASRNEGVELTDIGSMLIGSSNVSPSNTGTAYSRTSEEKTYSARYFTDLRAGATLSYDSDNSADINGIYAQLGINSWKFNDATGSMRTLITYNVKNVDKADTATGMKLTLKLYQKGEYETTNCELPIADYITGLTVAKKTENLSSPTNNNIKVYEYDIGSPKTSLVYDEDNMIYKIPINFSVYTGANDGFELKKDENDDPYMKYSNYMIKAQIVLYNANGDIIGSDANDHIIYTNAKIYSDWIDAAS